MSERIILKNAGDLPDGYQLVSVPGGYELLAPNADPVTVDVVEEIIHHDDDHHDHDDHHWRDWHHHR